MSYAGEEKLITEKGCDADQATIFEATDGVFIELFHGRKDRQEQMDDWGTEGPIFGPFAFVHITYACDIKMQTADAEMCSVTITQDDLVYYDGGYYGDFSIFPASTLSKDTRLQARYRPFEQTKAIATGDSEAPSTTNETAIEGILRTSAPLAHKMADLLELCGLGNVEARGISRVLARAVQQYLAALGNTFTENGHGECGRAISLESNSLFSS